MTVFIQWCNDNQGFIMVVLTFVYVSATIILCVFNFRSAKATREQVVEQKREFDEKNRPIVNAVFAIVRSGLACIEFSNSGTKVAEKVQIQINEEFLELLSSNEREALKNIKNSVFRIGINQKWHALIGAHFELRNLGTKPLIINISYCDDNKNYCESVNIDLNAYMWTMIYDSPEEDARNVLKSLADTMEKINKRLK